MPAGDYVMLFTVYSSSSSYAGSYWYLTSYPGLESYITHYFRNGVLVDSSVAYVPKEAGVYHYEVYITVPEQTETCITYTYGYERTEYYFFDVSGNNSNPAFNGMVIYRVKDLPQTSFTLDVSALRDNTFDVVLSTDDTENEYNVTQIFCNADMLSGSSLSDNPIVGTSFDADYSGDISGVASSLLDWYDRHCPNNESNALRKRFLMGDIQNDKKRNKNNRK